MEILDQINCTPITAISVPMSSQDISQYLTQIPQWHLIKKDGMNCLEHSYQFNNFKEALAFTVSTGKAADEQDHHPAIITEWGKVTVDWWTHKVKGLHLNDFVMAALTDKIYESVEHLK